MAERLVYISNARIPTHKAHGAQVMHMCAAFAEAGLSVELLVPKKRNTVGEDAFAYYALPRSFSIRALPIFDLGSRIASFPLVPFVLDLATFAIRILFSSALRGADIVYCRDYAFLFLLSPKKHKIALEMHDVPRWHFLLRRALSRAHVVIALTEAMREDLVVLGISGDKIIVASDGVRLEDFAHPESSAASRARLGIPLDKKIALYIGKIDAWKGTDTLFAAARLVPGDIRVAVIGGEAAQIASLTSSHPDVLFLGSRPYRELADNQAAADVLLLPNSGQFDISARYTSPLKLFSYMAAGKPIVASDLQSIRDVLDESSAYLVAPDSPEALARGIEAALGNDAPARAARARALVQEKTWEQRAARILAKIKAQNV